MKSWTWTKRQHAAPAWRPMLPAALVLASGLSGLAGCANNRSLPPLPAMAQQQPAEGAAYRIGPLDALQIVVWQHADLSGKVAVRPDGRISLPLVEDMPAAGRSPETLAREIEQRLSRYVQSPRVTVVVEAGGAPGAATAQVRVVGEAARPQSVPTRLHMTLMDVMIHVGGLTEFADGNGAVLVRTAEEGAPQYRIRLKDLLKRGDISANAEVIPGDIIIVPESLF